ncbi:alpha-galactosidase [Paenibacillus sp. GYB003]|uniref:alpha-galactosidase n=1 Tax=Paenibacillus sp. GYB003 TaxID=2994392 RepID=UPI002F96BA09
MKLEPSFPCFADVRDGVLTVGNSRIERKWALRSDGVFPLSVSDRLTGTEWLDPKAAGAAPAFRHPALAGPPTNIDVDRQRVVASGRVPEHLLVTVAAKCGPIDVRWHIRVYPDAPVIRQTLWYKASSAESGGADEARPTGGPAANAKLPADYTDYIPLAALHCRWKSVALLDVTDTHNNLVRAEEGLLYTDSEKRSQDGNFLTVHNNLTKNGLLLVKESPTAFGQLNRAAGDYYIAGKACWVTGSGVSERDLEHGEWVECYGSAVGLYSGGELEQWRLIRRYYDCLEARRPESDTFVMSNTWGDRSRDSRVSESFMLQELERAARLGVTHVQIDDGWQKGVTANSFITGGTWADYYSKATDFWDVHPERFPNGLAPVVKRAKELGIELGLWFSPDSTNDFAYWRQDFELLRNMWDEFGIRSFKLDGISIGSKLGEARFLRMLDEMTKHTSGDVYFNLDTTNGRRLGYVYHTTGGCLFLENRYSDFKSYYPHWTLRNLWMLAPYVPAGKLQMEFLNPARNAALYGDDPLSPAACGIAYGFAATMFANPLAWMELSGLSEDDARSLEPLVALFNRLKPETSRGHVLPVGSEPCGTGWTGLQCAVDERQGYLLAFREYTDEAVGSFRLWGERGASLRLECLVRSEGRDRLDFAGDAALLQPDGDGRIAVSLGRPLSFGLYRYTLA